MKVRFLLVYVALLCSVSLPGQIWIKGKIIGANVNNLKIFTPILGFYNLNNDASSINIKLDSTQSFSQRISLKNKYGFLTLNILNRNIYMLYEKKDTIDVTIDLTDLSNYKNWYHFKGSNAIGQLLLNQYFTSPILNYENIYSFTSSFSKRTSRSSISFIKGEINLKSKFIDSLYNEKLVSKTFHDLAKKNIANTLSDEFLKSFLRPSKFQSIYSKIEINKIIDSIHSNNPIDSNTLVAYLGDIYYQSFFLQKEKVKKNYLTIYNLTDSVVVFNKKKFTISNGFVPFLYITAKVKQEYIWGNSLTDIGNIIPDRLQKDDIMYFKAHFPNSIFLHQIENTFDQYNNKQVHTSKGITIDTISNFKSLADLANFITPENYIWVDLWATWCSPCKQEFKSNQKLDSFFIKSKIKKLYISFDNKMSADTWIKNIYAFQLNGLNIIANESLLKEILNKIYNNSISYSIPRYFILDKNGEVINNDFLRPTNPSMQFELESLLSRISK